MQWIYFEPHDRGGEVGPLGKGVAGNRLIEQLPTPQPAPTYTRKLHGEAGNRLGARWAVLEDGCNRNLTLALNREQDPRWNCADTKPAEDPALHG